MQTSQMEKLFSQHPVTGNTVFHELAYVGSLTLLERFRDSFDGPCTSILQQFNYDGEFAIHVAADTHRGLRAIRLIELLQDLGAHLDARDDKLAVTVLHIAVEHQDHTLAKWLCEQWEIDVNAENTDGLTAYQMAQEKNDQRMMNILRMHGARCSYKIRFRVLKVDE